MLAWALALLFAVSAGAKLRDPAAFVESVGRFGIVLDAWVPPAAWTVIALEGLAALTLPWPRAVGPLLACALLAGFLGVLGYGLALGLDVDCGCFGPAAHLSLRTAFLLDLGLLALAAVLARRRLRA